MKEQKRKLTSIFSLFFFRLINMLPIFGLKNISIKAKDSADAADAMKKMVADGNVNSGTTNLGALLKAKLDKPEED